MINLKRLPFDYERAIADAVRAKSEVLFVLGSALFLTPGRRLIPELALNARLPSVFHHAQWVEAGALMSYGFNFPQAFAFPSGSEYGSTASWLALQCFCISGRRGQRSHAACRAKRRSSWLEADGLERRWSFISSGFFTFRPCGA